MNRLLELLIPYFCEVSACSHISLKITLLHKVSWDNSRKRLHFKDFALRKGAQSKRVLLLEDKSI